MATKTPNKPAAPNAAITPRFQIGRSWRGVGDPERSATLGAPELVVIRTEGNGDNEEEFGASFPSFAFVASVAVQQSVWTLSSGTRLGVDHSRSLRDA